MNERLYELTYKLKEDISSDKRVLLLNKIEDELNNNDEVISLAYKKDKLSSEYSDLLSYLKEDDPIVKNKQKELYEAKKQLDSLPLVIKYNKAYQDVRILLEEISNILFKDLKSVDHESCCRKI